MNAPAPSSMIATATATAMSAPVLVHPGVFEQTFRVLVEPGDAIEARAFNVRSKEGRVYSVVSGFYDDASAFARDVKRLDGRADLYVTMNPVRRTLFDGSPNRITPGCAAATDTDIVRRRWLLLDFDPARAAKTSSTDDELSAAIARADAVWAFLRGEGWPDPVSALSGNGAHLLYRIEQPAADGGFVARVLHGLAKRFSDDIVDLDTKVSNASRITKLYGTLARKGEPTPERPHRRSILLGGIE